MLGAKTLNGNVPVREDLILALSISAEQITGNPYTLSFK